ncbi:MAG: redox-sensitive bicupin YhaK (pirin superfamily) [Planctomycetota bacterium]|jgi:redox-sensitive bicupin YhaK (pirin superfamily)
MITKRPSQARGHAEHGWLDAYHSFSFAGYWDPQFSGFSKLLVLNQDTIAAARGFGTHGHEDMEIITYVLSGALGHKDNMGNGSEMRSGDVQLMSAGSGVTHSEFNVQSDQPTSLLQMWIRPAELGRAPRYEQAHFPLAERQGQIRLVVAPDGRDGALTIGQDTCLYAGLLDAGESAQLELGSGRKGWLHVARGSLTLNGMSFGPGDGAAIDADSLLHFEGVQAAEFVFFDLP